MIYTINTTLENTTCESITLTLVPEKYYKLPETITVVNGTLVSYDQDTGVAVITGDDTTQISFESIPETYYLFTRVVNGVSTGDTNISYGGTAELHVTPEANYELPQDIIVVGADYTYDKVTGVIVLSNAKRDVQINVVCTEYIPQRTQEDLTTVDDTVYVPEGYYAQEVSKAVSSGTAGTPVATKGTVTNHSISVTPSVTNTKGYIQGGTLTGSPVSVSASELTSGNVNITDTQIVDVTNYSTAQVSDANLISENIKKDVSILGKIGTYEGGGGFTVQLPAGTTLRVYYHIVNAHWEDFDFPIYVYETDTFGYVTTQPTAHIWSDTIVSPAGETVDGYLDIPLTGFLGPSFYRYLVIAVQNTTDSRANTVPVVFTGTAGSSVSGPISASEMEAAHNSGLSARGNICYRCYNIYNPRSQTWNWATNKSFDIFEGLTISYNKSAAIYIDGYCED